jgi:hypothetical protein
MKLAAKESTDTKKAFRVHLPFEQAEFSAVSITSWPSPTRHSKDEPPKGGFVPFVAAVLTAGSSLQMTIRFLTNL